MGTLSLNIPYGLKSIKITTLDTRKFDVITPNNFPAHGNQVGLVSGVLESSFVGALFSKNGYAKSAAIAINDKTRPVPHNVLLPPLLDSLAGLGIPPENTHILIASGTHPPMHSSEYTKILPENIIQRYPIYAHDADDHSKLSYLGTTHLGTPIWINSIFLNSELRIVVGNIEPHQFQGFSGGVKSAAIGLAGRETINHNHALMVSEHSILGAYEDNPARQDVEEIGARIGVQYALNAILNQDKQIVHVLGGPPSDVMKMGIPISRKIYQVKTSHLYDLLLVSPGGYPKDINLYQSQKGLAHARRIVKVDGTIIMVAACQEGTGSKSYERWVLNKKSNEQVIKEFQAEGFRIGPHKAYQIARDINNIHFYLKSEMEPDFVRSLLIAPINDLQETWDQALNTLGDYPHRVGFMPYAASTIPYY